MSSYNNEHMPAYPIEEHIGLTKRELFAAMAMQGLCACEKLEGTNDKFAHWSVKMADALLEELNK